jgi:ribose-phosphate pyrophosphokinase
MVDTAGTLCKAVDVLLEQGARRVFAFCSHGVLSGPAASRIKNSNLTELVILDTIPLSKECMVSVSHRCLLFHLRVALVGWQSLTTQFMSVDASNLCASFSH